jgi:hypothetical protein
MRNRRLAKPATTVRERVSIGEKIGSGAKLVHEPTLGSHRCQETGFEQIQARSAMAFDERQFRVLSLGLA